MGIQGFCNEEKIPCKTLNWHPLHKPYLLAGRSRASMCTSHFPMLPTQLLVGVSLYLGLSWSCDIFQYDERLTVTSSGLFQLKAMARCHRVCQRVEHMKSHEQVLEPLLILCGILICASIVCVMRKKSIPNFAVACPPQTRPSVGRFSDLLRTFPLRFTQPNTCYSWLYL
mgnify:CR=1 FL=1